MHFQELFKTEGRVTVVTGAASGLGLACAEAFARNGSIVALLDVNATELTTQVERLRREGAQVEGHVIDVSDREAMETLFAEIASRLGRIDTLFANAGISGGPGAGRSSSGSIDQFEWSIFNRAIEVNLVATIAAMRMTVPYMKKQREGSIVVTTSVAGIRAEPICGYGYVASKAALNNVVRQASVELAPWNIRVNGMAPASFITNIGQGKMHDDPEMRSHFSNLSPLGRLAQPHEIMGLALLLGSAASSFLTGAIVPIDGGATAVLTSGDYSREGKAN
jgi:NAD(P)-dependent dehydrogenase (short-subunit alcohol dehydrogenase family)